MRGLDTLLPQLGAGLAASSQPVLALLVFAAHSNLFKALLFAPLLLLYWHRPQRSAGDAREVRGEVLLALVSCALALVVTWLFTTNFLRPRPLDPRAGLPQVAAAFSHLAALHPGWLRWGSFPSDHAAYLSALALALGRLDRRAGLAAFAVGPLMNGAARGLVGLHYLSDTAGGIAVGATVHLCCHRLFRRRLLAVTIPLAEWIEQHSLLRIALAIAIVEMAVMFHDLRFLDTLLFPPGR